MKNKQLKFDIIFLLIIFLSSVFLAFYNLGETSINSWDEGIYANVSYELMQSPSIVPTYNGLVWLDKPPVGFWFHMLGMKIFGLNNFGLRSVGSLFFVGTIILSYFIARKFYSQVSSFLIALAILVSPLLLNIHTIRTGDFEQYFIFFTLASFLAYIHSWKNPKWFWLTGLLVGAAFMTRGHIAILIYLAIFIHLFLTKKYKVIPFRIILYSLLLFCVMVLPWHIYALIVYTEDFLHTYIDYQFLQRIISPIEGHAGSQLFYLKYIVYRMGWVFILFLFAVLYLFWRVYKYNKDEDILFLIWILVFLLPIQIMKTKIFWYITAIVPVLYFICIPLLTRIFNYFKEPIDRVAAYLVIIFIAFFYFFFTSIYVINYVIYTNILPVDCVDSYLVNNNLTDKTIVLMGGDEFNGPAINYQLKNIKKYTVIEIANEQASSFLQNSDYELIFTNSDGLKYMEKTASTTLDKWSSSIIGDYIYWGEYDSCIILKRDI